MVVVVLVDGFGGLSGGVLSVCIPCWLGRLECRGAVTFLRVLKWPLSSIFFHLKIVFFAVDERVPPAVGFHRVWRRSSRVAQLDNTIE